MGELLQLASRYTVACHCFKCGIPIVMRPDIENDLRRTHDSFYCLRGHEQYFPGQSDLEKLRKEIELEKKRTEWARESARLAERSSERNKAKAAAYKGHLTKVKNRVGNGVCPCCKRSFQNLKRHMHTKHPSWNKTKESKNANTTRTNSRKLAR